MEDRRTKMLPKIIVGQLLVVLLITAIALIVLFYAQGLRLNLRHLKVAKTGIICLLSSPKKSNVYINGKLVDKKTPFSINLLSGKYDVEVRADGYVNWSASPNVLSGMVNNYKDIILFKSNINPLPLTDNKKIALLNRPIDSLVNNNSDLSYNDFEIWVGQKLIARFSKPLYRAIWYSDNEHILYQQGEEIRIIEKNGNNDTLLIRLSQDESVNFNISNKGDELYFIDSGNYMMAKIR